VEQVQTAAQKLSQPVVSNLSDAVTNATNAISNQQNLIISFDALMKKLGVLVKVGDEVAKVCFSVSSPLSHGLSSSFFQNKKKDPSLCQFSVADAFCRNEVESISIIPVLFPDISLFDQMVQAQQARDLKIPYLVTAMEEIYSFVVFANELKQNCKLQDIINQILKQTMECGYFIQEYTRHNFKGM
jgi:hypothetical protein